MCPPTSTTVDSSTPYTGKRATMAVTLKQEVNLSRRACRPTTTNNDDCLQEQRTLLTTPTEEGSWHNDTCYGGGGANSRLVTVPAPAKELTDSSRSGGLPSSSSLSCLLATIVMWCTGQVLLKLRQAGQGGWREVQQPPRLSRLCIYVVFCSALLSHNAFVLARPNLSAPASGEKVVSVFFFFLPAVQALMKMREM